MQKIALLPGYAHDATRYAELAEQEKVAFNLPHRRSGGGGRSLGDDPLTGSASPTSIERAARKAAEQLNPTLWVQAGNVGFSC